MGEPCIHVGCQSPSSCPDPQRLLRLAERGLAADEAAALRGHLAGCEDCKRTLAALAPTVPGRAEPAERPRPELGAGVDLGRYMILQTIGAGGMGRVYAAYDRTLDRRVALKQVRGESLEPEKRQEWLGRLIREARAMARLAHPNVVTVHDAFLHGDEYFVAMEFVAGTTLRVWLLEKERTTEEVLAAFLAAGEGLKAAHARGLVHRDFKPDNVLVGEDGRVRVTDFGLVLLDDRELGERTTRDEHDPKGDSGSFSEPPPTRAGTLMGTPAYMAPEQRRGAAVDARSDQFSFCVCLHEALFGHRPGQPRSDDARPPRKVSPRLREALRRGLAEKPQERFESMEALLTALRPDRQARLRRWIAAGVGAAALSAVLALVAARVVWAPALCSGGPARLAAVWSNELRAAQRQAFLGSGLPNAPSNFAALERVLDAYAADWAEGFKDACEATRVRGEQSEAALDARMACLDVRLEAFDALMRVLAKPDAEVISRGVEAAQALPPVRSCQRLPQLGSGLPPPSEAQRGPVAASRRALAGAAANFEAGRYGFAAQLASEGQATAKELAYAPLEAEWWLLLGRAQDRLGRFQEADDSLYQALRLAEKHGHWEVVVRARGMLMMIEGLKLERPQEAQRWSELANDALVRMGAGHEELESLLALQQGALLLFRNQNAAALAAFQRAAALRTSLSGPAHAELASILQNQGTALSRLGREDEAAAAYQKALQIRETIFGPNHIVVAQSQNAVGTVLEGQGKREEARARYVRAVEIAEQTLGPQSLPLATFLTNLGIVEGELGALTEAERALQRALEIRSKGSGPRPTTALAEGQMALGTVLLRQGRVKEAVELEEKARASYVAARGEQDPYVGIPLLHLSAAALYRREWTLALQHADRALALLSKGFGEDNFRAALARGLRGRALVELGREPEARAELERALAALPAQTAAAESASVRFALARALRGDPTAPARALELARRAAADLEPPRDELQRRELQRVKEWLASRR